MDSGNTIKTFYSNLSRTQKIILFVVLQFLIIILLIASINVLLQPKKHISVENNNELGSIPTREKDSFKEVLWNTIKNNYNDVDKSVINDVIVRDGTYNEYKIDGSDNTAADFIIDIDSLKQTYSVHIEWSRTESLPNAVSISCPKQSDMKYPETVCRAMYNNTYSLSLYLPHAEYPESEDENTAPNYIVQGSDSTKTIEIMVSVCDADRYKQAALDYLNTTPINLDNYNVVYEINDVDVDC